ncbi:cyclohydrolase [Pseudozyma hubeiensis SY62]|uniref:Cyclohydrolase n=1 Tax=Pseudozyma hubeiensis (strain SY62) TaxID=1305764 RepID=R9P3X8_PSEHS|nr:cyclohydrolase [Pseudozyma hubeiensis SY62]GAC96066.1 cyclohydrolase [Pseudozyma hubeiensis SY62]
MCVMVVVVVVDNDGGKERLAKAGKKVHSYAGASCQFGVGLLNSDFRTFSIVRLAKTAFARFRPPRDCDGSIPSRSLLETQAPDMHGDLFHNWYEDEC